MYRLRWKRKKNTVEKKEPRRRDNRSNFIGCLSREIRNEEACEIKTGRNMRDELVEKKRVVK